MSSSVCANCGGEYGLHQFETNQCPVGGIESPYPVPQKWADTTFDSVSNMKTYLVCSDTNYDLAVQVVNAYTAEEAIDMAKNHPGWGAWEGCEAIEMDTKTRGVVFTDALDRH